MLIMSTKRLYPLDTNVFAIIDNDSNYYYVHRTLYDQAVLLWDKYKGKYEGKTETCKDLYEVLPAPLNILSMVFDLMPEIDDIDLELEDFCGMIHMLSSYINIKLLLEVPEEVRVKVHLDPAALLNYRLYWDRFINESQQTTVTSTSISTPIVTEKEVIEEDDEEEEEEGDPLAFLEEEFDMSEFTLSDEELDNISGPLDNDNAVEPEPEHEPEPEPPKKFSLTGI